MNENLCSGYKYGTSALRELHTFYLIALSLEIAFGLTARKVWAFPGMLYMYFWLRGFLFLCLRVVNGESSKTRKLQTNEGLDHIDEHYPVTKKDCVRGSHGS